MEQEELGNPDQLFCRSCWCRKDESERLTRRLKKEARGGDMKAGHDKHELFTPNIGFGLEEKRREGGTVARGSIKQRAPRYA